MIGLMNVEQNLVRQTLDGLVGHLGIQGDWLQAILDQRRAPELPRVRQYQPPAHPPRGFPRGGRGGYRGGNYRR
jgi:hypothetical protein